MNRFVLLLCLFLPTMAVAKNVKPTAVPPPPDLTKRPAQAAEDRGLNQATAFDPTSPRATFLSDVLIGSLYHELGHALIDQLELPVLGNEEDAADQFSTVFILWRFQHPDKARMIKAMFKDYEAMRPPRDRDWDYSDEHGPPMQRAFNILCLALPTDRALRELAKEVGMSEHRQKYCPDELRDARWAWHALLGDHFIRIPTFSYRPGQTTGNSKGTQSEYPLVLDNFSVETSVKGTLEEFALAQMAAELRILDQHFDLNDQVTIELQACDIDVGFDIYYARGQHLITFCQSVLRDIYNSRAAREAS